MLDHSCCSLADMLRLLVCVATDRADIGKNPLMRLPNQSVATIESSAIIDGAEGQASQAFKRTVGLNISRLSTPTQRRLYDLPSR